MKKWLAILSGLSLTTTASATVISCGCRIKEENQKVVDGILKAKITDQVRFGTTAQTYLQKMTGDFIKTFLDEETQAIFTSKDFKVLAIEKTNGNSLTDFDLSRPTAPFNAQIKFNYGFIKNQILELTLEVIVEDEQIVQEIKNPNKGYWLAPAWNDTANEINSKIDANFIKAQIKHSGKDFFDDAKYQTKEIKVKNEKGKFIPLTSETLKTTNLIDAQIVFDYGSKKDQTTNLTIKGAFQEIEAELKDQEIYEGGSTTLTIQNYKQLKNVNVTGNNGLIEIGKIDEKTGMVNIKAKKAGNTKIKIAANNALTAKIFDLKINTKFEIQAELKDQEIYEDASTTLTILNYNQLKNVNVTGNNDLIEIEKIDEKTGTTNLKAKKAGNAKITITAKNAWKPQIFDLKIKPKFEIQAELKNQKIYQDGSTTLTILNYNQLKNVNVTGNNDLIEIGKIDEKTGMVNIKAKKAGNAKITISADNVWEPKILELKINAKFEILTELKDQEIYQGGSTTLTIQNYNQLKNVNVTGNNDLIEIEKIDEKTGMVNIKAKKAGNAKITISADNVWEPKTLELKINAKFEIQAELKNQEIYEDGSTTLTIQNYNQLKNINVTGNNDLIVIEKIDEKTGMVNIKAKKAGNAKITITANNAWKPQVLNLKINSKFKILAELKDQEIYEDGSTTLTILNYNQLTNVKIAISINLIEIGTFDPKTGSIPIQAKKAGNAAITIMADNVWESKTLDLKINAKFEIQASLKDQKIYKGESTTLTIQNYKQLDNVKITGNDLVEIGKINDKTGMVNIKAKKIGKVKITMTANNAWEPKTLELNIEERKVILASLESDEVLNNGRSWTTLTIQNYQKLENVKITGNDLVQINDNQNGTAIIKTKKAGKAIITITANNFETKTIEFKSCFLTNDILVSKRKNELKSGESTLLTLSNYDNFKDLINLKVSEESVNYLRLRFLGHGVYKVTRTSKKSGNSTETINVYSDYYYQYKVGHTYITFKNI